MILILENSESPSRKRRGPAPLAGARILILFTFLGLLAHCTPTPPDASPRGAIGRLTGHPPLPGLSNVRPIKPLTIGEQTRQATVLVSGGSLTLEIPNGSRRIALSAVELGAPRSGAEAGPPAGGLDLLVEIDSPSSQEASSTTNWETLEKIRLGETPEWEDLLLTLPSGGRSIRISNPPAPESDPARPGLIAVGSLVFLGAPPNADSPPNIILVSLDTLAASAISGLGGPPGLTPEIDRILGQSRSYDQAFAPAGRTLPSHAALFSGLYPHNNFGRTGQEGTFDSLVPLLANQGYLTMAITENGYVSSRFGFSQGFDQYDGSDLEKLAGDARRTFDEAIRNFEVYAPHAPLFLFVHTYEVHNPYTPRQEVPEEVLPELYGEDRRTMFEIIPQWEWIAFKSREIAEADFRRLQLLYLAGVYHLDRLVGDLVKRLEALDPDRRTLIVLTSDHGEEFNSRNVGHVSVREDVLRIPLAFYWPGKIAPARITEAAPLIDVFPTLFEILDIPTPPGLDGQSLGGTSLAAASGTPPRFAISQSGEWADPACRKMKTCEWQEIFALRSSNFKLVRQPDQSFTFHDMRTGAGESVDVQDLFPHEFSEHREWFDATVGQSKQLAAEGNGDPAAPVLPSGETQELDPQTRQRLRLLGYIE